MTADNEVLLFGGHADDIEWFRCALARLERDAGGWRPGQAVSCRPQLQPTALPSGSSLPQLCRRYDANSGDLDLGRLSSPRWYPGAGTLEDGRVVVVGGVRESGDGGYGAQDTPESDNPT